MVEGGFAYGCLFMSQHQDAPEVFRNLLESVKPSRILEIGTFHGGLTLLLRDIIDAINLENNEIWTYDINDQEFLKLIINKRNIKVLTKNLFNDTYSDWADENSRNEIKNYINQSGITMVLCDGGCKKCEFNLVSPFLKEQDIIMAHDYAPDTEYFKKHMKDKIWNWHEIQDSDIDQSCKQYNLKPYLQDQLLSIAWACYKKDQIKDN